MATFNRIVVTVLLLALIPIVTVGLIVPREAVELLSDWFGQLEDQLDESVSVGWLLIRVGLALAIDVLLVVLLYLQLRRPAEYGVPVKRVKGGDAQIAVDSIVAQLEYHLDTLPGVLDVKPKIVPHRRTVEVTVEVEMAANVSMAANIEEISAVVRRVVQEEMGIKLKGKPKLNLRTVPYPELVKSAASPAPAFPAVDYDTGDQEPMVFEDKRSAPPGAAEETDLYEPGSTDTPD